MKAMAADVRASRARIARANMVWPSSTGFVLGLMPFQLPSSDGARLKELCRLCDESTPQTLREAQLEPIAYSPRAALKTSIARPCPSNAQCSAPAITLVSVGNPSPVKNGIATSMSPLRKS